MSEYSMEFDSVDDFLNEWGDPCSNNAPVSFFEDDKYYWLDIAQQRKCRFGRIRIKKSLGESFPEKWRPQYE